MRNSNVLIYYTRPSGTVASVYLHIIEVTEDKYVGVKRNGTKFSIDKASCVSVIVL